MSDNRIPIVNISAINHQLQNTIAATVGLKAAKEARDRQLVYEQIENQQRIIETQQRITELLEEQIKNGVKRPDYVNKLIEEGLIYPDGITAIEGLDTIADYLLNTLRLDFVSPELLMQFRKMDGELFSIKSAREAVKRAKYPKPNEKETD
jgi:hypothetical protein